MTQLTITINFNLEELKAKYQQFFGTSKGEKITKADLSKWISSLAESDKHVVPGHDPDVLRRYPAPSGLPKELEGEVVSLHEIPLR